MGSFVAMNVTAFSNLLESCHNCTKGEISRLDYKSILNLQYLIDFPPVISFLCCGTLLDVEGIMILNSEDKITNSLKITLEGRDNADNHQLVEINNVDISEIDCEESEREIEDIVVKNEEIIEEIIEENCDDKVSLLSVNINERDPLSLESERNSSSSFDDHFNGDYDLGISNNKTPKILSWSHLGIKYNVNMDNEGLKKIKNNDIKSLGRKKKYPAAFTCEFCGKVFAGKDRAYKFFHHRNRDHTHEVIYKCELCPKTFWGDRELAAHSQFHKNFGHICDICGQKFAWKKNLTAHMLIHTERKLNCSFCNKKFRRTDHLKVHERIHTGNRPYQCRECDSGYSQHHQLKLHLKHCPLLKIKESAMKDSLQSLES